MNSANSQSVTWQSIKKMAFAHKRQLVWAHIISVIGTLVAVPIPLLMPMLVDEVLLEKPGALVAWANSLFPASWWQPELYVMFALGLTVVLRLTSTGLAVLQSFQFTQIAKDITYRIRYRLLQHLEKISMSRYETLGGGAVSSHLVTDVGAIDDFIGTTVSRFLVAVLTIIGTAGILLWMHWQLALLILFMNPVVIYFTMVMGRKVGKLKVKENRSFELFQQSLSETLEAIHQIRASNRERHFLDRVKDLAGAIRKDSSQFSWKSQAAERLSFTVFLLGFDVFRAVAMLMVVFSDLSVGEMIAVFGYLWFMMGPVQEVLRIQYSYHAANGALGRINKLLDAEREPDYPHNQNPFADGGTVSVTMQDVEFFYNEEDPVLQGVSLHIPAGQKVAFVGASGGGKTTMVQILLGLYSAKAGEVSYGGVSVSEIGLDVVRENVATVLQHPVLFNDTVAMNISLGRETSDEQLWHALEVAQLADTVRDMPEGLQTVVGRQGVRLSGGQRQRLAVARMVLTDPKVVILDEATSALDTETESKLHNALDEFLKHRTTIIIAHRLSAVKQADHVYVFEDGRIAEQGAHHELVQGDGLYARLYGSQEEG